MEPSYDRYGAEISTLWSETGQKALSLTVGMMSRMQGLVLDMQAESHLRQGGATRDSPSYTEYGDVCSI